MARLRPRHHRDPRTSSQYMCQSYGCPKRATPDADPCDALLSSVLAFTPPVGGASGAGLGSWAAVAQLPQANAWSAAAALGGYIYNTGGGLTYGRNASYRLDLTAKGERQ